jgi:proteasomal ATPase-associated factor 1
VIAISSNNDQVVYGGPDGYCHVHEISEAGPSSERKTTKLKGHVGDILDVKWFPSGQVSDSNSLTAERKLIS